MSTTFTIDTSTSRATPTPAPMKRLTVPAVRGRKVGGATAEPLVMLTAYTVRMAQLLDPHCDILLVGDSLGQVIYGLPSTIPVSLEMMCAQGAAVVRGSYHSLVIVDMPFGSYESSPEQAFLSAARILKETGAAGVKLEGGEAMASTVAFLSARGIPVMAHVGLTPQAVNTLGGYGARHLLYHRRILLGRHWPGVGRSVRRNPPGGKLPRGRSCQAGDEGRDRGDGTQAQRGVTR